MTENSNKQGRKRSWVRWERDYSLIAVHLDCFLSDLDRPGPEIYDLYKGRHDVKLAFDAMKKQLDADKTHLQDDEAVRAYFLIIFLALRIYVAAHSLTGSRDERGGLFDRSIYGSTGGSPRFTLDSVSRILKQYSPIGADTGNIINKRD